MNRATTINQTLNVIGDTTAEANLNVWGDMTLSQKLIVDSLEIEDVLTTRQEIRYNNTDANGMHLFYNENSVLFDIGNSGVASYGYVIGSEFRTNNLEIKEALVPVSNIQIQFLNKDSGGEYFFYFGSIAGGNEVLEITAGGIFVEGTVGSTSDVRLKENIKEVDSKKML